jgi:hypothetical protein
MAVHCPHFLNLKNVEAVQNVLEVSIDEIE